MDTIKFKNHLKSSKIKLKLFTLRRNLNLNHRVKCSAREGIYEKSILSTSVVQFLTFFSSGLCTQIVNRKQAQPSSTVCLGIAEFSKFNFEN